MLVLSSISLLVPQGAGAGESSEDTNGTATEVVTVEGTQTPDGFEVSGSAVFGGQQPVWVSEDGTGDGAAMVRVGDFPGVDHTGVDLIGALMWVPDPDVPELLLEWRLTNLPPEGGLPEGTRTSLAFRVEDEVFQVQAKFSNVAGPTLPDDPQGHVERIGEAFQLLGNCDPSVQGSGVPLCEHLLWLDGAFDERRSAVRVTIPLGHSAAPEIAPGADLRRNVSDSPDLSKVIAGYHAGVSASPATNDEADFGPPGQDGFAFPVAEKEVMLGIAPKGTDPHAVEFTTPAAVAADDTFTGSISTDGFEAGTLDVFARACFAANCAIKSIEGAVVPGSGAAAVLSLPPGPEAPDRSFAFWRGDRVGSRLEYGLPLIANPLGASCEASPCFEYTVRVESPGATRLRIGLDSSARAHGFAIGVTAPDGETFNATNPTGRFNVEIFVPDPPVGTYGVVVRPFSAQNASFAMRAKLEAALWERSPDEDGLFLPDLLPTPPYEFGFGAPLNPLNGPFLAPDDANPPATVGPISPFSCSPDDTVFEQVVRCLRFSFGLSNVGVGTFDIRWSGGATNPGPGPMVQCVERANGPPIARPAGEFEFHHTHLHTHYKDLIELELLRVTDPQTGTMVPAGGGRKIGYSPADQAIGRWHSFEHANPGTSGNAGSCQPGLTNRLGLSAGWGDVYRYQRAGNFVDFGLNPDGLYVVRLITDPLNNVLESSTDNNTSYTYIEVSGFDIDVLEYGRGQSPWDPGKEVIKPRHVGGVPW